MGFFNVIKELIDRDSPITKRSITVATAYGITAPVSVVDDTIKDLSKNDKKLCRYCGTEIKLEDKFCSKCGKKLGYLNENESQDEDE